MSKYASKVIAIAEAEVGYLEKKSNSQLDSKTANAGSGNYTKYARDLDAIPGFYNTKKQGFAWCDIFVDWCMVQAFGAEAAKALLGQPDKSCGAGCYFSANYYKQKGQFHTSNPKPGDQIFFWNSAKNDVAHTGLVYKVDSTKVYTIEGNTSGASGVVANGGGVCKKSYSLSYSRIYGYGRPAYDAEPAAEKTQKTDYTLGMRTLQKGCTGDDVEALQRILSTYGYNLGSGTPFDGVFGYLTQAAVMEYQRDHITECQAVDGIAGKLTMSSLLGTQ